jgi:excisionase family DNA binding protein
VPKNFKTEAIEPITATIPTASLISGLGRTTIYQRIKEGKIEAIKSGDRTLIVVESLREYLRELPAYRPEIQTRKMRAAVAGRQARRRGKS